MSDIVDKNLFILKNANKLFSYKEEKSDMFSHRDCILMHAVNAKGVMGSGVAKILADKYPEVYSNYARICSIFGPELEGMPIILSSEKDDGVEVVNLVTSVGYGKNVSSEKEILLNTKLSLLSALTSLSKNSKYPLNIVSNRFNSGLFGVPWEKTCEIIHKVITIHLINLFFDDESLILNCLESNKKIIDWTTCYV